MNLDIILKEFSLENKMNGNGPLYVALVVTRHAKIMGLPLNPDDLVTDGGGQVTGLGKGTVQSILNEHGIDRVLAEEGGRTSRGSIGIMRKYVRLAEGLAEQCEMASRLDVLEIKQFIAGNLHELGKFALNGRKATAESLLREYNKIIDSCETAPSLRVDVC